MRGLGSNKGAYIGPAHKCAAGHVEHNGQNRYEKGPLQGTPPLDSSARNSQFSQSTKNCTDLCITSWSDFWSRWKFASRRSVALGGYMKSACGVVGEWIKVRLSSTARLVVPRTGALLNVAVELVVKSFIDVRVTCVGDGWGCCATYGGCASGWPTCQ
jgi:hypothetical protein